ncbi:hypothetical protein MASR1M107_05040 [Ignavibacteriales bacterium]
MLSDRTVFGNLSYILEINNYPGNKIRGRVEAVLSDLGLLHLKNAFPKLYPVANSKELQLAELL